MTDATLGLLLLVVSTVMGGWAGFWIGMTRGWTTGFRAHRDIMARVWGDGDYERAWRNYESVVEAVRERRTSTATKEEKGEGHE